MINNQFSGNNMPFYGNNLNYNRNFKKEFQYDNLKQRSSGLGFFVFAYSLTMTVSAMIVVEVFKAFGSAKYIYSDNYSILTYFMDIFISVFAVVVPAFFYIKLSRNSLNDIISTKYVKQKKYDTHSVSRNGGCDDSKCCHERYRRQLLAFRN